MTRSFPTTLLNLRILSARFAILAVVVISLLLAFQRADAQQVTSVTKGKYTYRPIVKNNRILWFESKEVKATADRVSLYVFEDGNQKLITDDASVLFPGWPDMDDEGNVAFVRNVGTGHEIFLYDNDARKEIRITNTGRPETKVDMGLGTAKVYTGYVRIHDGSIVFKNRIGHIFLYDRVSKKIKQITTNPARTANLGDDDAEKGATGVAVSGSAHVKYYEFDGKHIVWMHEDRGVDNNSTISIFMATANKNPIENFNPKKITSFKAWVPNDKALLPGKLWNPFFTACDGKIIWQYYLPSKPLSLPPGVKLPNLLKDYGADMDDVRVGYYDGNVAKEISSGTAVAFQSVRLLNDTALWTQTRKEGEGKDVEEFKEVIVYVNGGNKVIVSYPEPDPRGKLGATFWDSVLDAEIVGRQVFWVASQVECFQQFKMPVTNELYCMFRPTSKIGFFHERSGGEVPFMMLDSARFGGSGELDRGLYAFFSSDGATARDIAAVNVAGGSSEILGNTVIAVNDLKKPDSRKWRVDEKERKQIIDAFSINFDNLPGCGGSAAGDEARLESITLDVSAEKSPTARMQDIKSVALYSDENQNGLLDDQDKLVGRKNAPVAAETVFVFSGGGLRIELGKPRHFVTEIEIADDVCPCGEYSVAVSGEKLGIKMQSGIAMSAVGRTTGAVVMPEAEVKEVRGDEQAGLPGQKLAEDLTVVFSNFPVRCGKAKFEITTQPFEKGGILLSAAGQSTDVMILDFTQEGKDASAFLSFQLGKGDGLYTIRASILMDGDIDCDNDYYIFREHAGKMVVQLIDLNDPAFHSEVQDNSSPDYSTWKSTMSADTDKLSIGGEGRKGVLADGASMLLIRARLIGFTEPPSGNVTVSISGSENIGHISRGLGEAIPSYEGGSSVTVQWVKTRTGVFAFALYTPPKNFGYSTASGRNVKLKVTYTMPKAPDPLVNEQDIALMKPPVTFVHGLWSGKGTWGRPYAEGSVYGGQYNIHFIDYAELSSRSFAELGTELKLGISDIVKDLRRRKIAATRVNVVGHSMGGLVARQFFADENGKRFFRKDNFGQGDIYKLITLGTPHFGSPVAWLAVTMRDQKYNPFAVIASDIGLDISGGAIDSLCPGSIDLRNLGVTHIPSHTVRAWNFDSRVKGLSIDRFYSTLSLQFKKLISDPKNFAKASPNALLWQVVKQSAKFTGKTLMSDVYGADRTDMLVTLESQSGGITQGANNTFDKTIHFDTGVDLSPLMYSETTSDAVASYIFDTLNRDIDNIDYYSPRLPAPKIQDPTKVCTQRR
ncbi:MAG: alpha/beta hydrolase [Pyrinomonadaceae bacterium]